MLGGISDRWWDRKCAIVRLVSLEIPVSMPVSVHLTAQHLPPISSVTAPDFEPTADQTPSASATAESVSSSSSHNRAIKVIMPAIIGSLVGFVLLAIVSVPTYALKAYYTRSKRGSRQLSCFETTPNFFFDRQIYMLSLFILYALYLLHPDINLMTDLTYLLGNPLVPPFAYASQVRGVACKALGRA